jgi:AcrR family transcriptional regulator
MSQTFSRGRPTPGGRPIGRPPGGDSAVTRQGILHAARESFAQYGYDGTSYREVADRAKISHGGIHYYFPTKQDLFVEVHREVFNHAISLFTAATEGREHFLDRVDAMMEASIRMHSEDHSIASFIAIAPIEVRRHQELRVALGSDSVAIYRFLEGMLSNDAPDYPRDADRSAVIDMLVAVMSGFSLLGATTRSNRSHARAIAAFQAALRGSFADL